MGRAFRAVILKELRHIGRDRRGWIFVLLLPFIMIFVYGYGINIDVRGVKTAVVDLSGGLHASRLIRSLAASRTFIPVIPADAGKGLSPLDEAERALRRGRVRAILVIPPGFDQTAAMGQASEVELILDGADALSARLIGEAEERLLEGTASAGVRIAFNPSGRSLTSIIPGLFAIILTAAASLLTCISVVRERESGTLDLLALSPLRSAAVVAGKALAYTPLIALDGALVLALSALWFRIPVRGDLLALGLYSALAILSGVAWGLLISVSVSSQREAMIAQNLSTLLPSFLLSGFILPLDSLPPVLRAAAEVLPATHFIRIARGLVLKAAPPASFLPDGAVLALFAAAGLAGAAAIFTRRRRAVR